MVVEASCTFIVPVRDGSALLSGCLASLSCQTREDWRAIVIDDGSVLDDSLDIVETHGDPRIEVVRHSGSLGPGAARNTGIRRAASEFIAPVDCDDRLTPVFLERLLPVLQNDPAADLVFPDFEVFGEASGQLRHRAGSAEELLIEQWLPGPGCLYRRRLWERVGGYCEAEELRGGDEDWDFYLTASSSGFVARHVPELLYRYRVHPGSLSATLTRYRRSDTAEFLYRRHQRQYDAIAARGRFLAKGCLDAAEASRVRGEVRRALALALKSWLHSPRSMKPAATVWLTLSGSRKGRFPNGVTGAQD